MKWQLPPLNYLGPFEATARLGSTVRAAEELGRTHGAISRQIKQLEDWLGQGLFHRELGRLELTAQGREYYKAISHTFDILNVATGSAKGKRKNVVRVQGPSVFIGRWLIPRLHKFYHKYPDLEVSLSVSSKETEFFEDACDIAITLESDCRSDMEIVPLMPDLVFPVCDMATAIDFSGSAQLSNATLLHSGDSIAHWDSWLSTVGLVLHEIVREIRIRDIESVIRAATNGHGIALVRGQLVVDEISSKVLVRPLPHTMKAVDAYWLCRSRFVGFSTAARAFDEWLRGEATLATQFLQDVI